MVFFRPKNLLSGFHSEEPDPSLPLLTHVGEQWAPVDWLVNWHNHNSWEFYLQLDGKTVWETEQGKQYPLDPGSFFAAAPRVKHRMHRPEKRHHYIFCGIKIPDFLKISGIPVMNIWKSNSCLTSDNAQTLAGPFRQMIREVSMNLPFRSEGIRSSILSLILEATRLFSNNGIKPMIPLHHRAVEYAMHILETQYSEKWLLNDLAKLCAISPNHLVELFTKELGVSPHQYLIRQRVKAASDLLKKSDLSITQIALETGFSSSQHFAKAFRDATGKQARDCREK